MIPRCWVCNTLLFNKNKCIKCNKIFCKKDIRECDACNRLICNGCRDTKCKKCGRRCDNECVSTCYSCDNFICKLCVKAECTRHNIKSCYFQTCLTKHFRLCKCSHYICNNSKPHYCSNCNVVEYCRLCISRCCDRYFCRDCYIKHREFYGGIDSEGIV